MRGDADRGLLQPLLVRPLRRRTLLLGRWLGAVAVCVPYVIAVALADVPAHRRARRLVAGPACSRRSPALGLGVAILAAISLAGSVVLASTANGIGVFMLFGAGLTAGLLGQIAEAIGSDTLGDVATITTWALPFEALYQAGLAELTADTVGITKLALTSGRSAAPRTPAPGSGSSRSRTWARSARCRPRLQRARPLRSGGSRW